MWLEFCWTGRGMVEGCLTWSSGLWSGLWWGRSLLPEVCGNLTFLIAMNSTSFSSWPHCAVRWHRALLHCVVL